MSETIRLGDVEIMVTRKSVKHAHLSVHPPSGRVTLVAPAGTRPEVTRAFAVSKLGWIRDQQSRLRGQERKTPGSSSDGSRTKLWGRRHLLTVRYQQTTPSIVVDHRRIILSVRPDTSTAKRADLMDKWHKSLLHEVIPKLIRKWEPKLGVKVIAYFVQRMKTKWGSCNYRSGTSRERRSAADYKIRRPAGTTHCSC